MPSYLRDEQYIQDLLQKRLQLDQDHSAALQQSLSACTVIFHPALATALDAPNAWLACHENP